MRTKEQLVDSIVSRDVLVCQSSLVDTLLGENEHLQYDDVENTHGPHEVSEPDADGDSECTLCGEPFTEGEDTEEQCCPDNAVDVYEWWAVTGFLAQQLRYTGAVVLDNGYGVWWGRAETGQSLTMDHDLNRVAENILGR